MKLHIHLLPIPPPDSLAPVPDTVFHYTTGLKLRLILNSGQIAPSTAAVPSSEHPVVWFSTSPDWEPTATKSSLPGLAGQVATAKSQGGLVRIAVPGSVAPHVFGELPILAGTTPETWIGLLLAGLELGADPNTWRFSLAPVPSVLFHEVEFFDLHAGRWLAIDLADLAARN